MSEVLIRLAELFDPVRLTTVLVSDLLPDLLVAGLSLLAFYLLWRVMERGIGLVLKRANFDQTAARFMLLVLKLLLMTISVVTALGQVGIDTGGLLASLGVVGLTAGFAARDVLSNIISGLFIFWDRPFVLGDLVEIDGKYGRVETITLRSTRVVTVDGKMLAVPNSAIINTTVVSYTNFPTIRLDVEVTVGTSEAPQRVRAVLLEMLAAHPEYMTDPAPTVVLVSINDYNLLFAVRVWIEDETRHIPERFLLRERVFMALSEANVEMPLETIALAPVAVNLPAQSA